MSTKPHPFIKSIRSDDHATSEIKPEDATKPAGEMLLSFDDFQKSRKESADLRIDNPQYCEAESPQEPVPGFIYLGAMCIEKQRASWPEHAKKRGKYYLVLGNIDYITDNLEALERYLYEFAMSEGVVEPVNPTEAMALLFTNFVENNLSAREIALVRERNSSPEYSGEPKVCATHDFTDSNVLMAEAFEAVMGREPDVGQDVDAAVWSAAWDYAKDRWLSLKGEGDSVERNVTPKVSS